VHANRVAGPHRRPLGQLSLFDELNRTHHSPQIQLVIMN
jgi:hypothetical protein